MTKHNIILQPSGSRGQVEEGQSIRSAARDLGVEIESICAENATCGKCMVLIEEGRFEKGDLAAIIVAEEMKKQSPQIND